MGGRRAGGRADTEAEPHPHSHPTPSHTPTCIPTQAPLGLRDFRDLGLTEIREQAKGVYREEVVRLQRPVTAAPNGGYSSGYSGGYGGGRDSYGGCGSLARRPLLTVPRKIADRIEAAVVGRGRRTSALLVPAPWAQRTGARSGDLASLYRAPVPLTPTLTPVPNP